MHPHSAFNSAASLLNLKLSSFATRCNLGTSFQERHSVTQPGEALEFVAIVI